MIRDYLNAIGHIAGTAGAFIQAIGGIFCLAGNHLITDEDEPQPQGDTFSTTELDGREEPAELQHQIGFTRSNP